MIKFKALSLKNFMSIGNVEQIIDFTQYELSLILGENLDLDGIGNRNGTGKTTIINGLSFAIYGAPIVSIKKDNLINDVNLKSMVACIDYEINGRNFRIERGRKPNYLRYYVGNNLRSSPNNDEAAGESKWTQAEIEKDLGNLSHLLFKYIISLHTKTTPFLSLKEKPQGELVEELLSITQLSQKAEILKEQMKQVKDEIRDEEIRIRTTIDSNDRIQKHINDLRFKSMLWDKNQTTKIEELRTKLAQATHIDIEEEIKSHKQFESWSVLQSSIKQYETEFYRNESRLKKIRNDKSVLVQQLASLKAHSCPTCGQAIHDNKIEQLQLDIEKQDKVFSEEETDIKLKQEVTTQHLEETVSELNIIGEPSHRVYKNFEEALNHRHKIERLQADILREEKETNPLLDQIATLSTTALQKISYDYLNELVRLKEHQDFLLKMLTSKESFIRKRIIDQNLLFLNQNLNHYLHQLNLPHEVKFNSDLTVDITKFGKQYDYDQLSTGQSNRLILGLSFAFRDTWESINHNINLLMIDELIDQGMDEQGTASSMIILKDMAVTKRKNIFLISHKEGLEDKVDNVFMVKMENGFTMFDQS